MLRRLTALALVTAALFAVTQTAQAHRLSGHPKTLRGMLALAKSQTRHDRASGENHWLKLDRRYVFQLNVKLGLGFNRYSVDSCLRAIIDVENPGWDPRRWNTAGSGAYGLPQALPASKMRSAGADYMWNPWTQVRWMIGYVNGRYGGSCAALAWWHGHSSY